MLVRVGVSQAKEIELEMDKDTDGDKLRGEIEGALADDDGMLWLTDRRGRQVGVPTEKVAYVEIDSQDAERGIGFGSGGYT